MKEYLAQRGMNEIDVDSQFKFRCTQCGNCCRNRDDIILSPKDLFKLAVELKQDIKSVVEQYCEQYIGNDSRLPVVRLKPLGEDKVCPLLRWNRCVVHKAKPTVCAMFPIGRAVCMDDKDQEAKMAYIFVNPKCGDGSETQTVRDWLNKFGISVEDQYFAKWTKILSELARYVHTIEPTFEESSMNMVWSLIYVLLYLKYDTDKEFESQFKDNIKKLTDILFGKL